MRDRKERKERKTKKQTLAVKYALQYLIYALHSNESLHNLCGYSELQNPLSPL